MEECSSIRSEVWVMGGHFRNRSEVRVTGGCSRSSSEVRVMGGCSRGRSGSWEDVLGVGQRSGSREDVLGGGQGHGRTSGGGQRSGSWEDVLGGGQRSGSRERSEIRLSGQWSLLMCFCVFQQSSEVSGVYSCFAPRPCSHLDDLVMSTFHLRPDPFVGHRQCWSTCSDQEKDSHVLAFGHTVQEGTLHLPFSQLSPGAGRLELFLAWGGPCAASCCSPGTWPCGVS